MGARARGFGPQLDSLITLGFIDCIQYFKRLYVKPTRSQLSTDLNFGVCQLFNFIFHTSLRNQVDWHKLARAQAQGRNCIGRGILCPGKDCPPKAYDILTDNVMLFSAAGENEDDKAERNVQQPKSKFTGHPLIPLLTWALKAALHQQR